MNFGLIPRSINYLFNQLRQRTQETSSVFYIRVSYYEIYNEHVSDLIWFGCSSCFPQVLV